jgi:aspartate kinase
VKQYHLDVIKNLFSDKNHPVYGDVSNLFLEAEWVLEEEPRDFGFVYDQVVSVGELVSSRIVSAFLNDCGIINSWLDARNCIRTDNTYREGGVDWALTEKFSREIIPPLLKKSHIAVTQGFIGGTSENFTTTLGREGSDYTAGILAHVLNAAGVTIWKDVPGVLNADPKWFDDTKKIDALSFYDAIELSYYGATVIHPKTIKPLQNKNIPLYVRSFVSPDDTGTVISELPQSEPLIPSFIFKMNQVLISISAKDFSFIVEENLSEIFRIFSAHGVKINLMQNSAISFSACVDSDPFRIPRLIDDLRNHFKVLYNENLELVTIRHYDPSTINRVTSGKFIYVEQRSRHTVQIVMRDI